MLKTKLVKIVTVLAFILSSNLHSTEVSKAFDKRLFSDDIKLVQEAIAEGADLNVRNETGNIALISAACAGKLEITKLLINSGADFDSKLAFTISMFFSEPISGELYKLMIDKIEYLEKAKKEVSGYFSDPSAQILPPAVSNLINEYLY